jgi:predicted methyltransferase
MSEVVMSKQVVALLAGAGLALAGVAGHQTLAQTPSAAIAAAVADAGRPDADKARDVHRHPAEVAAFAGVKPGQKIAEFIPGGGYFTRILSKTVGAAGHVYAIVPAAMAERAGKAVNDLAAANPNISLILQNGSSFTLPEKVDLAWTTDNYHDFHNPMFGPMDMAAWDKAVFDALKPGGVFLIVDYQTVPGAGTSVTNTLHRIESDTVKKEVASVGFVLDGESQVLVNPKDDHTLKIFDPTIRGEADQYVLRFRKPK